MTARILALKLAGTACMFLWAFVSVEYQWGFFTTLVLATIALGIGASLAADLGRLNNE